MLIAVKDKDRVVVMSTITDVIRQMSSVDMVCEDNRLIKIKDGVIYCFTSFGHIADIFLCDDKLYEFEVSPESIVKDIIPYMYKKVRHEKGFDDKPWDEPNLHNALTIIKDNRIFDITPTFYFKEENDFLIHGWNVEHIIGSLETTRGEDAEIRIGKALDLYYKINLESLRPCIVLDSKSMKLQVWEK